MLEAGGLGAADLMRLAAIHAASFTTPRPWSAAELAGLLAGRGVYLLREEGGFVMGRVVLDEVELLTIAVDPSARRRGLGARLLARFEVEARARGAALGYLEVAADNEAAQALYMRGGWVLAGRRRDYYHRPDGPPLDAVLMSRDLTAEP